MKSSFVVSARKSACCSFALWMRRAGCTTFECGAGTKRARVRLRRPIRHPSQAHPGGLWHFLSLAIQESPHAFPFLQILQHGCESAGQALEVGEASADAENGTRARTRARSRGFMRPSILGAAAGCYRDSGSKCDDGCQVSFRFMNINSLITRTGQGSPAGYRRASSSFGLKLPREHPPIRSGASASLILHCSFLDSAEEQ